IPGQTAAEVDLRRAGVRLDVRSEPSAGVDQVVEAPHRDASGAQQVRHRPARVPSGDDAVIVGKWPAHWPSTAEKASLVRKKARRVTVILDDDDPHVVAHGADRPSELRAEIGALEAGVAFLD